MSHHSPRWYRCQKVQCHLHNGLAMPSSSLPICWWLNLCFITAFRKVSTVTVPDSYPLGWIWKSCHLLREAGGSRLGAPNRGQSFRHSIMSKGRARCRFLGMAGYTGGTFLLHPLSSQLCHSMPVVILTDHNPHIFLVPHVQL